MHRGASRGGAAGSVRNTGRSARSDIRRRPGNSLGIDRRGSEPARGTRATRTECSASDSVVDSCTSSTSRGDRRAGLVVLAVDDEAPALDEISYLLRGDPRVGTVLTATDAADALQHPAAATCRRPARCPTRFCSTSRCPAGTASTWPGCWPALPHPPAVAFLSAHDDRAVEAYEIGALDYLLKPVRAARLAEAVTRLCAARDAAAEQDRRHQQRRRLAAAPRRGTSRDSGAPTRMIAVDLAGSTKFVPRAAVCWAEAQGDYARLHMAGGGSHLIRTPLAVLQAGVGAGRVRPGAPRLPGGAQPDRRIARGRRRLPDRGQRPADRRRSAGQPASSAGAQAATAGRPAARADDRPSSTPPGPGGAGRPAAGTAARASRAAEVAEQTEHRPGVGARSGPGAAGRVAADRRRRAGRCSRRCRRCSRSCPPLQDLRLLGVPLAWWVLGLAAYPVLYLLARLHRRQAERIERDFTELLGRG